MTVNWDACLNVSLLCPTPCITPTLIKLLRFFFFFLFTITISHAAKLCTLPLSEARMYILSVISFESNTNPKTSGWPSNTWRKVLVSFSDNELALPNFALCLSQMPSAWEDELHNIVQMNLGSNPQFNVQELNAKPRDGFPL